MSLEELGSNLDSPGFGLAKVRGSDRGPELPTLRESEVPIGDRRFRLAQDTKPSGGVTPSLELQIGRSIYIF